MAAFVKDAGVWKPAKNPLYTKDGSIWKPAKQASIRDAGIWKPVLQDSLYQTTVELGLTTNLKLCLDAGEIASYDGTSQTFADLSGLGSNFNLGAASGVETSDPTFIGVAGGLSVNDYFTFDGGDYFRIDGVNPAWINNLHKNNALSTVIAWVRPATTGTGWAMFGNNNFQTAARGYVFYLSSAGLTQFIITKGSGGSSAGETGPAYVANAWQMVSLAIDEAGGANQSWLGNGSTFTSFDGVFSSPTTGDASYSTEIASPGNAGSAFGGRAPNLSRMGGVMAWEGVRLSQAQISEIYEATRGRFGV